MYIQARAEDFQIGVAITIYAREAPHLNFLAPHLFLAFRCGAKEIYVVGRGYQAIERKFFARFARGNS